MQSQSSEQHGEFLRVLKLSGIALFVGWGLLHIFWDVPYRSVLWSESYLRWFISGVLGVDWTFYVTSPMVDSIFQTLIRSIGAFYFFCAILIALAPRLHSSLRTPILLGALSLLGLGFLFFKESAYQLPVYMEFSAQIVLPIVIYLLCFTHVSRHQILKVMQMGVALTFVGHGIFALGISPVPGNFIDMIISVLGTTEEQARLVLKFAGTMDLLLAAVIFVPRLQAPALAYATMWGLLTTTARPLSYFGAGGIDDWMYWLAQALYRVPHLGLPLATLIFLSSLKKPDEEKTFRVSGKVQNLVNLELRNS
jgi:hypothetical protein